MSTVSAFAQVHTLLLSLGFATLQYVRPLKATRAHTRPCARIRAAPRTRRLARSTHGTLMRARIAACMARTHSQAHTGSRIMHA